MIKNRRNDAFSRLITNYMSRLESKILYGEMLYNQINQTKNLKKQNK